MTAYKYKILTGSFMQYKASSANTFVWGKKNIVTKENIKSVIDNFMKRQREVFVYEKHKTHSFEERTPIGVVKNIYSENRSELSADIIWNENAKGILEKKCFYPSVEFVGRVEYESEHFIYWKDIEIKALAMTEDPASKGVSMLCLSSYEYEKIKGEKNMIEKIKDILLRIKEGDEEAKKELVEILKKDNAMIEAFVEILSSKEERKNEEDEVEENEDRSSGRTEEKKLSSQMWEDIASEYALSMKGVRCSSKSVQKTYKKANALYGLNGSREETLSACKDDLVVLGIKNEREEKGNLSASDENAYREIAKMFEPNI